MLALQLLTVDEAAQRLLITKRRLQQLCREGVIDYVAITPRKRGFIASDIEKFAKSQRNNNYAIPNGPQKIGSLQIDKKCQAENAEIIQRILSYKPDDMSMCRWFDEIGFSENTFQQWKKGYCRPTNESLLKLSKCIGISVDILTGTSTPHTNHPKLNDLSLRYDGRPFTTLEYERRFAGISQKALLHMMDPAPLSLSAFGHIETLYSANKSILVQKTIEGLFQKPFKDLMTPIDANRVAGDLNVETSLQREIVLSICIPGEQRRTNWIRNVLSKRFDCPVELVDDSLAKLIDRGAIRHDSIAFWSLDLSDAILDKQAKLPIRQRFDALTARKLQDRAEDQNNTPIVATTTSNQYEPEFFDDPENITALEELVTWWKDVGSTLNSADITVADRLVAESKR